MFKKLLYLAYATLISTFYYYYYCFSQIAVCCRFLWHVRR